MKNVKNSHPETVKKNIKFKTMRDGNLERCGLTSKYAHSL